MSASISILLGLLLGTFLFVLYRFHIAREPSPDSFTETFSVAHIPSNTDFDIASTPPHPYRPWKSGKFHMTMGLKRMPEADWLLLDNKYLPEQTFRRELLATLPEGVYQQLPGPRVHAACVETLECIVAFLTKRYPRLFHLAPGKEEGRYIHNTLTNLTFKISEPFNESPLVVAAQLVMEDINILMAGTGKQDPTQYFLVASFTMAPVGWYLQERIGWPLYKIHLPVPLWGAKLRKPVENFFRRLLVSQPVERYNWFIQTNDVLFQQEPFAAELEAPLRVEDVRIRHERQTLRRLPRTRAVVFMVRTYVTKLTDLEGEEESVRELLGAVEALPEGVAGYKARQVWGEGWCREVLRKHDMNDRGREDRIDGWQVVREEDFAEDR